LGALVGFAANLRRGPDQTAGNFRLATLVGVGVSLAVLGRMEISGRGIALASASGALAPGLGYTVWCTAMPHLSA
jgi:hypothetical protein